METTTQTLIETPDIASKIFEIRGVKVMLDRDLAVLYGVKTIVLRQQVKRNIKRFPDDFHFQLDKCEVESMVSQNVIPSMQHLGGSLPHVFTEHGILMLSSILRSERAIQINILIMRLFVELRKHISSNPDYVVLNNRLSQIENTQLRLDSEQKQIINAIDNVQLEQKIDSITQTQKVNQLSEKVGTLSQVMNEFQNSHIVINIQNCDEVRNI